MFFAVFLIGVSYLLSQLTAGQDIKIIKDLGLAAMSLFGLFIAVFIGIGLVSKEVEKRYGGSIGVLLEMNGPPALHRYEADVLDEICHNHTQAVIAAPGAIVSNGPLYDQLLASSWSIWPKKNLTSPASNTTLPPIATSASTA